MKAYHYNNLGIYTGICEAYEDPMQPGRFALPENTTFDIPPETEYPFVAVYQEDKWIQVEDHRKHLDSTGTLKGGTPYWLPEDNYQSEARYMTKLGPLPAEAILTRPEKTERERRKEELENLIQNAKEYLAATDYVPLKILEEPETASEYMEITENRKTTRASIDPLLLELQSL